MSYRITIEKSVERAINAGSPVSSPISLYSEVYRQTFDGLDVADLIMTLNNPDQLHDDMENRG